jgi:hypothetical protein
LQGLGIHDAGLYLLDYPVQRSLGHGFRSGGSKGKSKVDRIKMPPRLDLLDADETTAVGLRLMKCFLILRGRRNREELISLAEQLVQKEKASPESAD